MKKFIVYLILAVALLASLSLAPVPTATVLIVSAVLAGAVFYVANTVRLTRRSGLVAGTNTNPANWGTHAFGKKTYLSSAAIATRYFLLKAGADSAHAAVCAATADEPIGVSLDQPAAAEVEFGVELLGPGERTVPVVAGGAITEGAKIYSAGNGKVIVKPTAAGTYWCVGSATGLSAAAADGDVIAMIPQKPRKLIVIAALGNANGAIAALAIGSVYAQAEVQALRGAAETLADDLRAIAAALNGDADVALATT